MGSEMCIRDSTGRAGQGGITIAFCDENEGEYLRGIEKMIRQDIPVDEDHPFHSEKARSHKGNKAPKKQQNRGRGRSRSRNGKSNGSRSNGKSNHQPTGGRNGRRSGRGRRRKRKHQARY